MSDLSIQRKIVLEEVKSKLSGIQGGSRYLDSKANFTLSLAGATFALISSWVLIGSSSSTPLEVVRWPFLLALMCQVGLIACAGWIWNPRGRAWPGTTDTDQLYKDYIQPEPAVAVNNLIQDYCHAIDLSKEVNAAKGKALVWMYGFFALMIIFIGVGVGLSVT